MNGPRLVDPELVVHAFAPIEGYRAPQAHLQVRNIWAACRDLLGMDLPIAETGLPTDIPDDWLHGPESRPLAAIEQLGADCQAILRRDNDTLNFSMVFGQPRDAAGSEERRQLRIGSALPVGWVEFDRWWDEIALAGTDALLGLARLYLAKRGSERDETADVDLALAVHDDLPEMELDADWWRQRLTIAGSLELCELSPRRDTRIERRLAVVAAGDQDLELSAFTWSHGGTAMPPLARYLMHAARLRAQYRIWSGGQRRVTQARQQLADRVARLHEYVQTMAYAGPTTPAEDSSLEFARLRADLTTAIVLLASLREMRQSVDIATGNMASAVEGQLAGASPAGPLEDDRAFAGWFGQQLDDAISLLSISHEAADQLAAAAGPMSAGPPPEKVPSAMSVMDENEPFSSQHGPARRNGSRHYARTAHRLGFGLDVVNYSARNHQDKRDAQRRVAEIVIDVLADLRLSPSDTDHQGTGDGLNMFLPVDVEVHSALLRLVRGVAERLDHDNKRYTDRLRLRMSTVFGPIGPAALGFSSNTIIEVARLLNCAPLRTAMEYNPDAHVAVLVSDALYSSVFTERHAGLDVSMLHRVEVGEKSYERPAWLWIP
jgi:hypothetical protein